MVVMDFDDLDGQIRWWLEHDKEREKIAQNAYKLVMSRHTAEIRAKEIIEAIK
jgi:spore maturation protein CgeB